MIEYGDQYATAISFMIRGMAREVVAGQMFWNELPPEQRTPASARRGLPAFARTVPSSSCPRSARRSMGASKPANARLVAATLRDTREVWATYLYPQDRARMVAELADLPKWAPDEMARADLASFTAALQAVN